MNKKETEIDFETHLRKSLEIDEYEGEKDIIISSLLDYKIHNWPQLKIDPDESLIDEESEDLDLENLSILEITNTTMTFMAGGDWQDPLKCKIEWDGYQAKVIKVEKDQEWTEGLSNKELCDIFNI